MAEDHWLDQTGLLSWQPIGTDVLRSYSCGRAGRAVASWTSCAPRRCSPNRSRSAEWRRGRRLTPLSADDVLNVAALAAHPGRPSQVEKEAQR